VRARHLVVTGAALVALAGCGTKPAAAPAPAAASAAASAAVDAPSPASSASLDAGTLDATAAYLTGLGRVDRRLVADRSVALDNGAATCVDVVDKRPEAELEKGVATRFAVGAAQAKKILALAKSELCLE
jgi:hypothetical protein